jgi:hypothetical protein
VKINKIQILIPGGGFYGGLESLHQFVYMANSLGVKISCVYIPTQNILGKNISFRKNINLKNYKIKIDRKIDDTKNVCIVVPETFTGYIRAIRKAKISIWWLSVDNYIDKIKSENQQNLRNYLVLLANFSRKIFFSFINLNHHAKSLSLNEIKNKKIIHLCQSYYSYEFLKKKKFKNLLILKDFIQIRNRRKFKKNIDIILNSNKGQKYNELFIKEYNEIFKIEKLKNMSLNQTQKKLHQSKFFIDFGHHPGRDRIPREAVSQGSKILIKKEGAAKNKFDVNIDNNYKFTEYNLDNEMKILEFLTINKILDNNWYNVKAYSKKINNDKIEMKKQIKQFIKKINYEKK